ncbi:HAD family hydrolase [Yinghuangia soli]|uniref:Cof-type HAD-IIB family hydrolase n=1 Tax=Yinghuangia soli TaxID=2908204 RepID=A0AA41Q621_9ACTN|nr:HAD family hydrolase [Yinghuangia soli]MCF2531635.1 Cof-type HAD-IIB family hydrolase [Yinghuangia soli]
MIRLVATDLDGTLLRSDGGLSPRTLRALRLAAEAGADVVLVTARPPRYVDALARRYGLTGTAVCSNGAQIYDMADGRVLSSSPLEVTAAREAAALLGRHVPGVGFAVETGLHVVFTPGFELRFSSDGGTAEFGVGGLEELWSAATPIVKLLAWSGTWTADAMLAAVAAATAAGSGSALQVTHSGGRGLLEISASEVSKGAVLAGLCQARGIDAADVLAFGDMPNDLGILGWAGSGWAMANAHPEVLAAVPRHTASNNEDGVAAVLERHFG